MSKVHSEARQISKMEHITKIVNFKYSATFIWSSRHERVNELEYYFLVKLGTVAFVLYFIKLGLLLAITKRKIAFRFIEKFITDCGA